MDEQQVGLRLERIRLSRNITQAQLAERSGVSRRTIARLENGEGSSLDTFLRVLNALELTDALEGAIPEALIRPIERVRSGGRERQRARPRRDDKSHDPWTWDTGEADL